MPGPLSNLFSSDDSSSQDARMPVSSIDTGQSDDGDGSQQQQSFQESDDGSDDAPAFAVSSSDPGTGGGLSDDYLEPQ